MNKLGLILTAFYLALAPRAEAGINYLQEGTKFSCTANGIFFISVEVLKDLDSGSFMTNKFEVKIQEYGPRLDANSNTSTNILMTNPIQTRTMAGAFYQTVLQHGKVLALTNLMYSIFKDKPVGFTGKIHDLQHGYVTPVTCKFASEVLE
jgi:hypothetical protein